MFNGCSSFDVEQPFQQAPVVNNNPSSSWLHTLPAQMPWSVPANNQPSVMRFTGDTTASICSPVPEFPLTAVHGTKSPVPLPLKTDSTNAAPVVPEFGISVSPEFPSISSNPFSSMMGAFRSPGPELPNFPKSQTKRKSWECEIECAAPPTKQLITEEKMAENLNCLHISNSYVSHQIGSNQPMSIPLPNSPQSNSPESTSTSSSESSSLLDSTLDGKDRTVSLCEQLRKLISETSVLQTPLLNKVERPSNALVLWQPPGGNILKNLEKANGNDDKKHKLEKNKDRINPQPSTSFLNLPHQPPNERSWDDLMDNNNSRSAMDMNLFTPPSSNNINLQPSEVPLPDEDFMTPDDSLMDF